MKQARNVIVMPARRMGMSFARRQAAMTYYPGVRCPGCAAENWEIGRTTAECARCGTPMQLSAGARS
jgi:ribosomal protein S27E